MEKKNLSNTLKDHIDVDKAINNINFTKPNNNNTSKLKYPWSYSSTSYREDYLASFSWPPRSYTCSFCKREFRSAQALGGHMNVHRRDRARLRQSPPKENASHCLLLNPNPSPNLNPNPSPNSVASSSVSALCSTAVFGASSGTRTTTLDITRNFKTGKSFLDSNGEFEDGRKFVKKGEILTLDLEIGLSSYPKDDLDLELRLGY